MSLTDIIISAILISVVVLIIIYKTKSKIYVKVVRIIKVVIKRIS